MKTSPSGSGYVTITDIEGGTVNLTGDVLVDTWGALDDTAELDPAAASATIPSILRGLLTLKTVAYETVAASQTAQVLGSTGAAGDLLHRLIIIPASVSPGAVALLDNATSINVLPGGANSLTELKPIVIDFGGLPSASGAWKITTGANVSVIAIGNFT